MEEKRISTKKLSRRGFLGAAAVAAAAVVTPFSTTYGNTGSSARRERVPSSKFRGVQIGAITYSFRDLPGGVDAVLKACVDAGLSSVELMGTGVEEYLGAPLNPLSKRPAGASRKLSDEEKRVQEQYNRDLKEWRRVVGTPEKYAQLRKKFNDAGVNIHIYKWVAGNTEEELDYSFKVAKALGAIGISAELDDKNARLMGPVAARNGMYAILHNHYQYGEPGFDLDRLLAYSPANMLNFDIGHYLGSTGLNRRFHPEIPQEDCEYPRQGQDKCQQSHTEEYEPGVRTGRDPHCRGIAVDPEREVAHLCDIELEYPVASWSTSVRR